MIRRDPPVVQREQLNLNLESIPEPAVVVSSDGRVVAHTAALRELTGFTARELEAMEISVLLFSEPETLPVALRTLVDLAEPGDATGSRHREPVLVAVRGGGVRTAEICVTRLPSSELLIWIRDTDALRSYRREAKALATVFDANPSPILRVGRDGDLLYANRGSWILLEFWGINIGQRLPDVWRNRLLPMFENGESMEIEVAVGMKVIHLVGVPVSEMGYVSLYGIDVTARKLMEEQIALNAQVVETAIEAVVVTDPDFRILDVNRAFTEITGFSAGDVLGESAVPLLESGHGEESYLQVQEDVERTGRWQGELWGHRKSGEQYPMWLSVSAARDESNRIINFALVFADISRIKEAEEHLYQMAHFDGLTGLANRRYFIDRLTSAVAHARRSGRCVGLMFVDLDGFKVVNDNLGHNAGDQLLCTVAERLRQSVRGTDTVARIGGDEFTVILPEMREARDAAPVAEKVLDAIARPIPLEGEEVTISASVGVAVFPADGDDAESLLRYSDTAMYRIKQAGKNSYQYFSPDMNTRAAQRISMRTRLKRALDADTLSVYYQPLVNGMTGKIEAVEALVRWFTEDGGSVPPSEFIPLAEDAGLIHVLGANVLRRAGRQWAEWNGMGITMPRICVNVSAPQFRGNQFQKQLESIAAESGMPPASVEVELTESLFIEESDSMVRRLNGLRSLGVSLCMDDFGTKYSSLGYLKRLPIDRIKIDRSFIQEIPKDRASGEIVAAVLAMGKSLRLEVVGEGVERREQLEFLRRHECGLIQGYLVDRPLPRNDMEIRLRAEFYELESLK